MFRQHTKETVADWARRLRYFYFIRALGGHANDGDAFQAGILFDDRNDLERKLAKLSISPGVISPDDPQPVPGQSYPGTEYAKFKVAVYAFPDMEQPGMVSIGGQKVYLTIGKATMNFSISGISDGNLYEVSEADFQSCLQVEKAFDSLQWQQFKDVSLEQSTSCVSPTSYPEFY